MLTRRSKFLVLGLLFLTAAIGWGTSAWGAVKAKASPPANEPYRLLCEAYLDGKWDELEKNLGKDPPGLTSYQRIELAAIRRAVAEGRPDWWQTCKANFGGTFNPVVWGKKLDVTFAPGSGQSVQMSWTNNRISLTVSWPTGDMDNPDEAEHGFSKGDLTDLSVWGTLGTALSWEGVTPQALANLDAKEKLGLMRYQDFRSDVTGLYYATPKARRWGEFLYLMGWKDMYAKMPTINARKANGAMFLVEVLTDASKYPSLPPPKEIPAEKTEEKLAEYYRDWIEAHGWTVAEDIALRKAIAKFALANESDLVRSQQVVMLPNKLRISLDPEEDDKKLRPMRDAWLKAHLKVKP